MKFLVDAHLPRSLCALLAEHAHDAAHTLDLPTGNATKDRIINRLSFEEQRIVVSNTNRGFQRKCSVFIKSSLAMSGRACNRIR